MGRGDSKGGPGILYGEAFIRRQGSNAVPVEDDGPVVLPEVPARAWSDDRALEIEFEASEYLSQCTDDQLRVLKAADWGHCFEADGAVWFYESSDRKVKRLCDYIGETDIGFEVEMNAEVAEQWLKAQFPELHDELYGA